MNQFLSDNIDQLDLALDQLAISNRNFDRFALMLIDNVVELTLHRFIQDRASENDLFSKLLEPKHDPQKIKRALGQNFEDKVKASRCFGLFGESVCESILNLHSFRNSSYHKGLRHENILHSLAILYFRITCEILKQYKPRWWCCGSTDQISYRAKKYLGESYFDNPEITFLNAYSRLDEVVASFEGDLVKDLSIDMESVIESTENDIQFLLDNSMEEKSRVDVVLAAQALPFSYTDEAKEFGKSNGFQFNGTNANFVKWLQKNYKWQLIDPIPGWCERLKGLSAEKDKHKALKKYCDFIRQTEDIRSEVNDYAAQLDSHIQLMTDLSRGK